MKKLIICFTTLLLVAACMEEPEPVEVSSVTITPELLEIIVGETQTLTATVLPENATDKIVTWTTSDESIVTVNDGKLNAVAPGTATITAKAGDRTATCKVTVSAATTGVEKGYEWVDLGLPSGLKWATCNVGASAPEDYGDYFAWGEAEPYYTVGHSQDSPCHNWKEGKIGYNWLSYKFRISGDKYGIDVKFSKYNTYDKYGTIDNKTTLELVDDAARANWGGSWRMPTDDEWTELITKCTWILTIQNGINGRLVTGPNGNSIFLPDAGNRGDTGLSGEGSLSKYWSSSLAADYPYGAMLVYGVSRLPSLRFDGCSVRPVTE